MIKITLIILFVFTTNVSGEPLKHSLNTANGDFIKGLYSKYGSHIVPKGYFYDCQNITVKDGDPKSRNGRNKDNATALGNSKTVTQLHEYHQVDGDFYCVWVSSQSIYYTQGDGTYTSIFSSATVDDDNWQFITFDDKVWGGNGVQGIEWDGSTVTNSTWSAKGKYHIVYQNRRWIAGNPTTPSQVWFSYVRRGDLFYDDDGDENTFYLNSDDGDKITGMMVLGNKLIITKRNSTHAVYAEVTNIGDFIYRVYQISDEYGCVDGNTMQIQKNKAIWLTRKGFVEFDGSNFILVTKHIQPIIDEIKQTKINQYFFEDTTESDFDAGSHETVDITTTSGDITTAPEIDQQATDERTPEGSLSANQYSQSFLPLYTCNCDLIEVYLKKGGTGQDHTVWLREESNSGTIVSTATVTATDLTTSFTWYELNFSPRVVLSNSTTYFIYFDKAGSGSNITYWGQDITATTYTRGQRWLDGSGSGGDTCFKQYTIGKSTFTSQEYDLTVNNHSFGITEIEDSGTTSIATYEVSVATYSGGQTSWTTITDNTNIALVTSRYCKWRVVFNKDASTQTANVQSMKINYYTTGVLFPADSEIYDRDYYVTLATASIDNNDCILVRDENGAWLKHTGNFYCIGQFREELYAGSSLADGWVYQLEVENLHNDNGNAIPTFIDFGDYDFGHRYLNKKPGKAYITYENTGEGNLAFTYYLDKRTSGTSIDLDLDANAGFIRKKIMFPIGTSARYFKYYFAHNTVDQWWKLNGIDTFYITDTLW